MILIHVQSSAARNLKLLPTTLTELRVMAAPAIMGSRRNPFNGPGCLVCEVDTSHLYPGS